MAEKSKLRDMLDNLINNKPEQAQVHFHDYLQGKMQEVIHGSDDQPTGSKDDSNKE